MSLPFTSVVSYHTDPLSCGVAKFSKILAEKIGVPFVASENWSQFGSYPLLSLKWSEFFSSYPVNYAHEFPAPYGIFWHDAGTAHITDAADVVFYADPSLGSPGLWCPSLITPRKRPIRLFSFGMAHKLQTDKYKRVRELLDAAGKRYHLRVSVGIHEGTSLDGAEKHFDALREIMGPENVTILGILSDDAVSEELQNADHVLAFFESGVRANNTTVHAAIAHGCHVITNHDTDTPDEFIDGTADIASLAEWPKSQALWPYTWERLIQEMKGVCDKSRSRIA
jgi:hypothetical protein